MNSTASSMAIVVPNWNGINEIEACLDSLRVQESSVRIIVVDNGSKDGSLELVKADYPDVDVLEQPDNLGFAGGVNVGIRHALKEGFAFIGLFNSDAIADPQWSRILHDTLTANPNAGIATGLLLHADGKTIDSTGDWYSTWGLPFPRGRNDPVDKAAPAGKVFSASGGASLYRAEIFDKVGLFDESFFAYYEDVDISFRSQLMGFTVTYEPRAIAYHERGAASSRIDDNTDTITTKVSGFTIYQTFKNLPLLFIKDVPLGLMYRVGVRFSCAYLLILANAIKNGHGIPAVKGFFKSITLLPHALRERHNIQRNKAVTTDYIASILWPDLPPDQSGIRKVRKIFTGKA